MNLQYRVGTPDDALAVSGLAMYVFLDTYATDGLRTDLTEEVLANYGPELFRKRLTESATRFVLAERDDHLLAFSETSNRSIPPHPSLVGGLELVRLYVHRRAQRTGIGRDLLSRAEEHGSAEGFPTLWLTAWSGNGNALAFYSAQGYDDIGATTYTFQDHDYENRIFRKTLTR